MEFTNESNNIIWRISRASQQKGGTGTGTLTFGDGCGDRGHCDGSGMKGRRGFLRRGGVASRVCSPRPCDAGGVASFSSPDP